MKITASEYKLLGDRFREIAERHLAEIPPDGAEHVTHCLAVGELEMAFESFVLSVLEIEAVLAQVERAALRELGVALGLDKESIFQADFWVRAQKILS
jgi:hypothetical protein